MAEKMEGASVGNNQQEFFTWSGSDLLSPVRNQQHFWCCWAMVCCDYLEFYHRQEHKSDIRLDPQDIVDCITPKKNIQETTGHFLYSLYNAFLYIQNHGVRFQTKLEKIVNRVPKPPPEKVESSFMIKRVFRIPCNESSLRDAVLKRPVPLGIKMTHKSFRIFWHWWNTEDVFIPVIGQPEWKDGKQVTAAHAVLLIGFNFAPLTGPPYWIIKNNWGEMWGEKGIGKVIMQSSLSSEEYYLEILGGCDVELLPKSICCKEPRPDKAGASKG